MDVEIKPEDLEITVCRASGKGGQGVNTTDSAVQIIHKPSGLIVRCADQRSQQKNKARAMTVLRSRLLEAQDRRGKREIRRAAQRAGRHRRTQRAHPHLQFPAEPRHRPSHRADALQPAVRDGRRLSTR